MSELEKNEDSVNSINNENVEMDMEMEIDETVPDTPIIENPLNRDPITITTFTNNNLTIPSTKNANEDSTINQTKEVDIVILDDDDDQEKMATEDSVKKTNTSTVETMPCDVIDLVDKKGSANTKCINYACKSGIEMITAPLFSLTFYRVKSSPNKLQEVCKECFDLSIKHYDNLGIALQNKELLIKCEIPIRNDLVEIDDSDSDNEQDKAESDYFKGEEFDLIEAELEDIINNKMGLYKIVEQSNMSVKALDEAGQELKGKFQEVDTMLHDVRKKLDTIHHDLYAEFKVRYETLPSISIMDVYLPTARNVTRSPSVTQYIHSVETERRSPRRIKPISYAELDDPGSSSNSPIVIDNSKDRDVEVVELPPVPADLPPKGEVTKPPLKINEMYYAVHYVSMGSWVRAKLLEILPPGSIVNGQVLNQAMYCVSIESKQQTKEVMNRLVVGKEIAYSDPCPVLLDVGARVIAVYREINTSDIKKLKKDTFYPGIIAEPLSASNNYRYLIFFDDGYAQYVDHKMVNLIYEASENVWEDMHIDSRLFIKKYLKSYPERPMVKLRKDQNVRTEYNGRWWLASVMNIDCSLVQMFFETSNRIEWIYRGSTRLNPMFKEELAATNRQQNKTRSLRRYNETGPYVQYTRNEPDAQSEPIRSVARKSTSKTNLSLGKTHTVPFLPISNDTTSLLTQSPPPSKVVYFTPRAQANTKTLYKHHICSIKCKTYITYDVKKLKGYNPLSKPLLCGWNRVTYKHKGKREINYKAPCGRFIRNMSELHKYLRTTQSEMTVDLFDFDFWVHCLAEFVLERNSTVNKDMSGGLENVSIPVVNYMDHDMNSFCNYSIKREPMEGVHLNLDPEFLCGCNCEDDCEDKSKCECWKLTLQGLLYLNKNASPEFVGYTYRRLPEPVATGIYECNSRCKCAATCLNRVVQNPLQLKLQVFKTPNRGWGIRCLNDIPQGAFICIYAGSILTEQMANEGGKNYGDEYLAELDYIEVVEKMKEDYEEEAVDGDVKERRRDHEESGDEEKSDMRYSRRRNTMYDSDFVPPVLVSNDHGRTTYKTRLRKRGTDGDDKKDKDDDDTVVVSDDEDAFREPSSFNPKDNTNLDESRPLMYKSVRDMFGEGECVYVMDAKVTGNIGRFLNHSCSPNVFVQNVFVDTHDLRFPWVAFFALTYIRAGTELTWNYNYDVGSVPGKVLYCHCSSQDCRGRLL